MATNTIGAGVVLNEGQIDVDFRVEGNSAEYLLMVDGSSDCVGIGIAAPEGSLEIKNTNATEADPHIALEGSGGSDDDWSIWAPSGVDTLNISYQGNATAFVLDTNSRISLSNNDSGGTSGADSTSGNTFFGYLAGTNSESGSHNNTCIGHKAAGAGTWANFENNVIIGTDAGKNATGADQCVIIGQNAGTAITGSEDVVLIGQGAGAALTDNVDKVIFIGRSAGATTNDTAATGSVGIGHTALTALTSGVANTAVGYQAGVAITTGGENTCVGEGAGANITTGGGNTAIGRWTMNSGGSVITGGANTCIGYQAGQTLAGAGATNTFVGGYAGEDTTTGTQNVFVGYGTEGNASGCTNQIAIGYNTTGQADNSVTLGNADVTAVYMSSDSGAVVHCRRSINKHNLVNVVNEISLSGDNGSGDGGSQIQMLYNDSQKWKFYQRNNTTIGSAFAFVLLDAGNDDGVYINQGGSGWTDASDERLKTSIAPIESAVDKLNTLQAINFKWKYGSEERQAKNNIGLLAQEVYKVIPEAVDYHDPEDFKLIDHPTIEGTKQAEGAWGIDKSKLIPVLIKAVQELSQQVEELKAKIN